MNLFNLIWEDFLGRKVLLVIIKVFSLIFFFSSFFEWVVRLGWLMKRK